MRTLNLEILAHVNAGKTSLTERLLYAAGVIDEIGSVDDGSTQTDSLALERQRGITIKSAVVSFVVDDVTVNLIDTPGHPDFIAEVERALHALDGAVLVISAVEGVQAQTRVLMRTLQRLRIPTLIFVNKIDRAGASYQRVLDEIAAKLTPWNVPMGTTRGLGTRAAEFVPYDDGAASAQRLTESLAEHDDAILTAYVEQTGVPYRRLRNTLARHARSGRLHPVFFGSAITGAGVGPLIGALTELLPATSGDPAADPAGVVFKVERGTAGEKVAYVRMFRGTLRTREVVRFDRRSDRKVTAISVFDRGAVVPRPQVAAGQIGKLWGLPDIQIGDTLGGPAATADHHHFAPPTLETVVVPRRARDKGALHTALAQLAEQDPLINLRQDDVRQELSLSLYGEVQKEVIQQTLSDEFGLDVEFRRSTTICIERPDGSATAAEVIAMDGNPFLATVGLRVDPAPAGSGVRYVLGIEPGSLPVAFQKAVEETVHTALAQGIHGWRVTDCTVTFVRSGYWPRQSARGQGFNAAISSTAGDFRNLTPLVLMTALSAAGTTVYEPMHRLRLEIPVDKLNAVGPVLTRLGAVPRQPAARGSSYLVDGEIPAASVHELQQLLPGLTRGEGVLECPFAGYRPVRGQVPRRPRTDHNPLNRKEYLLNLTRRV